MGSVVHEQPAEVVLFHFQFPFCACLFYFIIFGFSYSMSESNFLLSTCDILLAINNGHFLKIIQIILGFGAADHWMGDGGQEVVRHSSRDG